MSWLQRVLEFLGGSLGRRGENTAARFLRRQGLRIRHRNYRCPLGEVDLIAEQAGTIVFVEVKTRASSEHGEPWEAVDKGKRRRLTRLAAYYLKAHRKLGAPVRFDVVAVTWPDRWHGRPTLEHFAGAFDADGPWSV